ncbi:MAG: acetyltransferase [Gammaproteobacteria bacterium]|nr:acetyltransferase [Gammaproteobacteria bacterium]MDE0364772.1 acetyltransferase [Gammaproteobacteria bacterium]
MAWLKGSLSLLFILLITIVVCVPLYAMALLRLPLSGAPRRVLTRRMDFAIDFWVSANRFLVTALKLVKLEIDWPQEALSRRNWYVVVCNHQSWADILLLQNAFRTAIPPLKFFTKRELIWLPLAGPAMYMLGFPYVRRAGKAEIAANPALKHADRDSTLAACNVFRNHPTSVLIFLEGTRFTQAKRAARHSRFERLLNPRTGGLGYVLSGLRDEVGQLVDVTIAYPGGPPSFWDFLSGRCPGARMTVRTLDLDPAVQSGEPKTQRQALQPFVENLWRAKDERLGACAVS